MTEMFFTVSVIFVGYVVYVLVDEQLTIANTLVIEVNPEPPVAAVNPSTARPARNNAKAPKVKPVAETIRKGMPELVGMTAGSIWRYLNKNGPTSVAKMVRELPDDSKTVQRSIGWLAQEGKITLNNIGRVETIALKD
ncbi:winged helix-turn-helix domain-containing protein [Methyloglobulus sp.]|uniref:winged helix-turn-helix domain-containing protein n=1 Tax=Methyloglobulus sp. TaxID=2518622 RepID=UPI00398A1FB5